MQHFEKTPLASSQGWTVRAWSYNTTPWLELNAFCL